MDSTCSRHGTRDALLFLSITKINGGKVTFGDNLKGKIIGVDNKWSKSSLSIEKLFIINSLKHNLLSTSKFYIHACYLIKSYMLLAKWVNK